MNSQNRRESAQILQFPPPGSRLRGARLGQTNMKQIGGMAEISATNYGGAWYHEAAIVEADRPRKP